MSWLRGMCFALVMLLAAGPGRAETRALLIGVSDYDSSIGLADLRGPANDVTLMRGVLQGRGVTDITVLADRVEGAARPTRAAILDGFARMADRSGPDDLVVVQMSGHGTQQRDMDGDETDGLDEVFLPADTGRSEQGTGLIPNALVDEEIGQAVAAIRATGADVFLVMDSCHSGSGLRAGSPDSAARYVDPALLGVDLRAAPPGADGATAPVDPVGGDLPGGYLAFYAAQSSELAREVNLDPDAEDDAGWFGLFTAKLAARMQLPGAQSYRQVFQGVLADMNDGAVPGGSGLQTPLWAGTLIDRPLFGGSDAPAVEQYAVSRGQIEAGLVHGLPKGTLVALVADAAAGAGEVIGHAQMTRVKATRSSLTYVAPDCVPDSRAPCLAVPPPETPARFARLLARPVDSTIALAPPVSLETGRPLAPDHPARAALDTALAEANASGRVSLTLADTGFRTRIVEQDGALWFGPEFRAGEPPAGLRWQPGTPLAPLLIRIARAELLAAMLEVSGDGGSLLNPNPVRLEPLLRAVRTEDIYPADRYPDIFAECEAALAEVADSYVPLPPGEHLKPCDQVFLLATGTERAPYDVNRVHIDGQYCVNVLHDRVEGMSRSALMAGAPLTMCADRCPEGPTEGGAERLFLLVTRAEPNAAPLNLAGYVETCGPDQAASSGTRGSNSPAARFLTALSGDGGTRGTLGAIGLSSVWVESYRWTLMPRAAAYRAAGLATPP